MLVLHRETLTRKNQTKPKQNKTPKPENQKCRLALGEVGREESVLTTVTSMVTTVHWLTWDLSLKPRSLALCVHSLSLCTINPVADCFSWAFSLQHSAVSWPMLCTVPERARPGEVFKQQLGRKNDPTNVTVQWGK